MGQFRRGLTVNNDPWKAEDPTPEGSRVTSLG
jgi:hypothetical protein